MSGEGKEFEKAWQKAFEDAEITPQQSNWEAIEKALDDKKSRGLVIFYRISIAASVLMALSLGLYFGMQYLGASEKSEEVVAKMTTSNPDSAGREKILKEQRSHEAQSENQSIQITADSDKTVQADQKGERVIEKPSHTLPTIENNSSAVRPIDTYSNNSGNNIKENGLIAGNIEKMSMGKLDKEGLTEPEIKPLLTEIPNVNYGYDLLPDDDKEKKEPVFLAGINFSAGAFDQTSSFGANAAPQDAISPESITNYNSALRTLSSSVNSLGGSPELQNYDLQISEDYTQSVAYSYGANFGFRLGRRFRVFSGLNYTKAFSNQNRELGISQNGKVLANKFYDEDYNLLSGNENRIYNGDADIKSEFDFLSIPIKAGYSLIDKKFSLTLFTGISSEFLLQNSVSDGASSYEYYENFAGNNINEAYNSFYLNGIFSVNAGYTIGQKYYIYLEPMYKRALTDFAKTDLGVEKVPSFKMMMIGLSYQF